MNIKSLLLGSAAALAAVSGAQAADAIVAAEPEPMEYVRVCDAFGTGYFYIPGTETCLKIGGYIRFQTNFGPDLDLRGKSRGRGTSDWDTVTRGQLQIDAKNDTELGTLESTIVLQTNADLAGNGGATKLDTASFKIAGFKFGYYYSWWDDGIAGETDVLQSNSLFNSISYTYDGGAFKAGISVDELEGIGRTAALPALPNDFLLEDNAFGVAAMLSGSVGGVTATVLGGYDNDREEGAIRAILTAAIGAGTLNLAGIYATDPNAYYNESKWTVAASYEFKATDKLTITPAAQYFGDYAFIDGVDAWRVGLTVGYKITAGLKALATVQYQDVDKTATYKQVGGDETTGFLRLQRDF
ncbi:membrane protein [Pararhizobium polonicum]|uniref:Porin n=1 Tax=Pararhizobium polonicum TaxID=1612624 RepID=A0A1C7P8J6_9HYPH|nr:porin [Pararhizobium polonicum]OBZ96064.1 membrane protein [Pararhizobium polonicum]